ncbi:MAG: efflux RND transporter periplasmic adaptor subunit [Desulfotalea sp.]
MQISNKINTEEPVQEKSTFGKIISVVMPFVAIACAVLFTIWMINTKPKAKKRPPIKNSLMVETKTIHFTAQEVIIEAMGNVSPARKTTIAAEVSGIITSMNKKMNPGGYFLTNEAMVQIDKSNYLFAKEQRKAEYISAKSELAIEAGNQLVAQKEFELLGESVSSQEQYLMLRKPQLEKLEAGLKAAKSNLKLAEKNLSRTTIKAPYNGMVNSLNTNIGSLVGGGSGLVEYIGTDLFWLELLVPVSDLKWITFSTEKQKGSEVKIFNDSVWGKKSYRIGHVMKHSASLEAQGRLAQIIVVIDDPLALKPENKNKQLLLLNSYVKTEIAGGNLNDIVSINRKYIHDNNKIWVLTSDNQLNIRQINPLFKNKSQVFINKSISEGELLITSTIPAPINGMLLQKINKTRDKKND